MLTNIHTILGLATVVLGFIYWINITADKTKKDYNNVKNIKIRIVLSSIECILFTLKIILLIVFQKSGFLLANNIFCAIIWALNIVLVCFSLKRAQRISDIEFHIIFDPYCDDSKIIDADGYEVLETDEESKEITTFGSSK